MKGNIKLHKQVGRQLRGLRRRRRLYLHEVQEITGLQPTQISRAELGRGVTLDCIIRLAEAYDCDIILRPRGEEEVPL